MEILKESIQEVFKYIAEPELTPPVFFSIWQALRIIFLVITAFFVGVLIYVLPINGYLEMRFMENYSEFKKTRARFRVKLDKSWGEVVKQARNEKEAERKLAVIEADDMINSALSQIGYEGETLVDKLEGLNKEIIPNIEEITEAHKKRRDIAYDPNRGLSKEEAEKIISTYEETFKDLQIF